MSLLNSASLCVTPNGYKEGTLYSVIPNTTLGDMTVVRATTATRVNSAGLVELVPYNLLTYSEQFNNSDWSKNNVTISANSTIAPDGTLTADTMTNSSTGYGLFQFVSVAPSTQYTFSFYVQKGTNTSYILSVIDAVTFAGIDSLDYSSQVGTNWVRVTTTFTTLSTTSSIRVYPMRDGSSTGTAFLWGAQLVAGTLPKDYLRTETRLNIPRLDYSNGSCPSLLVEPQRTNLVLYSEQFDNAGWGKSGVTITANNTTSPDGTSNADLVTTTNATSHELLQSKIVTGVHTCSFYVKKNNSQTFYINMYSNGWTAYFNLNNGTVSSVVGSGVTANVTNAGNGWYRCSITFTSVSSEIQLGFLDTVYTGVAGNPWTIPTSVGTSGWVWGAQLEAGSYATSYIPTTSAAVTRNADVISKTGISSLIGQTEGAVFVDINVDLSYTQNDMRFINISDGTSTNWWFIGTNVSNQIRFYYRTGATTYVSEVVALTSGRHKLAFAYKSNDYVAYVDGTQIYSLNSLIVGATSQIDLGNNFGGSGVSKQFINSAILFPTRLTNAELISLTT